MEEYPGQSYFHAQNKNIRRAEIMFMDRARRDDSTDMAFVLELREWAKQRVAFIDTTMTRIAEDNKNHSSWQMFEPTEQEGREQRAREDEYIGLGKERAVYIEVWQRLQKELDLEKFLNATRELL